MGGIATGLLVWGLLTVVGLAAVLAVELLGADYLVFLGGQALWQGRRGPAAAAWARSDTPADTGSP